MLDFFFFFCSINLKAKKKSLHFYESKTKRRVIFYCCRFILFKSLIFFSLIQLTAKTFEGNEIYGKPELHNVRFDFFATHNHWFFNKIVFNKINTLGNSKKLKKLTRNVNEILMSVKSKRVIIIWTWNNFDNFCAKIQNSEISLFKIQNK